jgi:hypothetical protein
LRGVERRIKLGLDPNVGSVASVFMSRWDAAVADQVPTALRNRLGLAMGLKVYQAYRQLMNTDRSQRAANAGARIQRLLWASTKTKDPDTPDRSQIRQRVTETRDLVADALHDMQEVVFQGYLLKEAADIELVQALRTVASG